MATLPPGAHFDRQGRLVVPLDTWDKSPAVEGWRPWWVNYNGRRTPKKLVTYKREEEV